MLVRVVLRGAARVERSAGADGGGGGGAPGESRADGADAGADAAGQSDARLAGDVGRGAAARRAAGWWTTVRDWAGAALPAAVQARLARAEARLAVLAAQIAALEAQQQAAVRARGADECVAPVGAAEGRGDDERVGVARRRAGVARVPESAADRRAAWALRRRRTTAASRSASKGSVAPAMRGCKSISIQLAWNWVRWQPHSALTQWYRARFGHGKRARRIGIVAVARKLVIALWRYVTTGVVPDGRDPESRVGVALTRLTRAARTVLCGSRHARPPQRRYRSRRVRIETEQSLGAAPHRACPDRRRALGHDPRLTAGPA